MTLVLGLGLALACEAGAAGAKGDAEECRAARSDWAEAAVAARAPIAGLEECLAAEPGPCGADLAAVRATVAELESHERRIAFVCEGRR